MHRLHRALHLLTTRLLASNPSSAPLVSGEQGRDDDLQSVGEWRFVLYLYRLLDGG